MKKLIIALVLICCCFALFAEPSYTQSSRSYVNIPLLKVLESTNNYIVVYINNFDKVTYVSIPKAWFKQGVAGQKGKVRALPKKLSPYMTLNFDGGEFVDLSLSMPTSKLDSAWGVFAGGSPMPAEIDPIKVAAGN